MNTMAPVLTGLKPARLHRDQRRRDAVVDGVSVRERGNPLQQIVGPLHQTIIHLGNQSFHLRPDKCPSNCEGKASPWVEKEGLPLEDSVQNPEYSPHANVRSHPSSTMAP